MTHVAEKLVCLMRQYSPSSFLRVSLGNQQEVPHARTHNARVVLLDQCGQISPALREQQELTWGLQDVRSPGAFVPFCHLGQGQQNQGLVISHARCLVTSQFIPGSHAGWVLPNQPARCLCQMVAVSLDPGLGLGIPSVEQPLTPKESI